MLVRARVVLFGSRARRYCGIGVGGIDNEIAGWEIENVVWIYMQLAVLVQGGWRWGDDGGGERSISSYPRELRSHGATEPRSHGALGAQWLIDAGKMCQDTAHNTKRRD